MQDHRHTIAADIDGTGDTVIYLWCLPRYTGLGLEVTGFGPIAKRAVVTIVVPYTRGPLTTSIIHGAQLGFYTADMNGQVLACPGTIGTIDTDILSTFDLIVAFDRLTGQASIITTDLNSITGRAVITVYIGFAGYDG